MVIQKVGVVGAGLMGHGIAQVAAQAGYDVVVVESDREALERGLKRIELSIDKLGQKAVEKGQIDKDKAREVAANAKSRVSGTMDRKVLADRDIVIEAIVEDLAAKKLLFAELGKTCKASTILASNTSSFPIAELSRASGRPESVVGLHFFNPVQLMKLVEVVHAEQTGEDVFAATRAFAESLGKTPISCKDTPGFVVNRLLVPYMVQALAMLERGDATKEDIDTAMQHGCGYPMGPITLTDYVGLDTTLSILRGWVALYPNEPAFAIPDVLERKVNQGKLGRKSGEGFYKWDGDKKVG